jgi:hypothetical protein
VSTLAVFAGVPAVHAYKAGRDFDKSASSGGGGGIYFSGAPTYRKWNCTACHQNAAEKITIRLDSAPRSLLTNRTYQPGASYQLTFKLQGEHRGFDAALNTNGMVVTVLDDDGAAAGSFSGFDANEIGQGSHEAEISTSGLFDKRNTWTAQWNAPAEDVGPVTFYVAMVDGDGASTQDLRTSDPLNDDVAFGIVRLLPSR